MKGKLFQLPWPLAGTPRCQMCAAIAASQNIKVEDIPVLSEQDLSAVANKWGRVGAAKIGSPHVFAVTAAPVEGDPLHSRFQALCDSRLWGGGITADTDDLLGIVATFDEQGARQGMADVALDLLALL